MILINNSINVKNFIVFIGFSTNCGFISINSALFCKQKILQQLKTLTISINCERCLSNQRTKFFEIPLGILPVLENNRTSQLIETVSVFNCCKIFCLQKVQN